MKARRRIAIMVAGVITALTVSAVGTADAAPKPPPYGGGTCHVNCGVPARSHGHHSKKDKNPSKKAYKKMSAKQEKGLGKYSVTGHAMGKTSCHSGPCRLSASPAKMKTEKINGVDTRVPATAAAGSVYCSWYEAWVYEQNIVHAKLWQLTQKLNYCWQYKGGNTHVIVSHTTEVHPHFYNIGSFTGWKYAGTTANQISRPNGNNWVITSHVEGHMEYCPPRIWCVQEKYPYTNIDAYGNGYAELNGWGD